MFRFVYIAVLCVVFLCSCRSYHSGDPLDRTYSAERLKNDFDIFETILRQAHPSLNTYTSSKRLQQLYDSLRETITYSTTMREFYNKLFLYTNEIGCSHTSVNLPEAALDTLYNRALFFPLPVANINGRLLVNSDIVLPHGTEILSVNGKLVPEILDHLAYYNPVDGRNTDAQVQMVASDFGYEYFTLFGGAPRFAVQLKDTLGKKKDTVLAPINLAQLRARENAAYYFDATDVPYSLHIDDNDNYALMRVTTFHYETDNQENAYEDFLKNSFELLRKKPAVKTLVVDLRENRGGYLYSSFLLYSYLAKKQFTEYGSVTTRIRSVPYSSFLSSDYSEDYVEQLNQKLEKDFSHKGQLNSYLDSLNEVWDPQSESFTGNVYVITNANVMSAASCFAAMVQHSGRGEIVGVGTAGGSFSGNGFQTLEYRLPYSGVSFVFPYARINYPFQKSRQECGLIPDHLVPDTYQAFHDNKDAQLRFIIDSLLRKKNYQEHL